MTSHKKPIQRRITGVLTAATVTAVLGASILATQGAQKSVNDGVYSAAQAERGQKVFEATCTTCHDPGRFTGPDFIKQWSGQPLHALFDTMSTTMPEDNPGSLKPQQYADLVAYFLQLNKYPAGQEELKGAAEALRTLKMEAPKAGAKFE